MLLTRQEEGEKEGSSNGKKPFLMPLEAGFLDSFFPLPSLLRMWSTQAVAAEVASFESIGTEAKCGRSEGRKRVRIERPLSLPLTNQLHSLCSLSLILSPSPFSLSDHYNRCLSIYFVVIFLPSFLSLSRTLILNPDHLSPRWDT